MQINQCAHLYSSKILILFVLGVVLTSCGIQINDGLINQSSDIASVDPGETTYSVDQTDDDNSTTGFGGGTHLGTTYSSSILTLNTTINNSELDESWTPKWDSLIAYYKFSEDDWTTADSNDAVALDYSGNDRHATPKGSSNTLANQKMGDRGGDFSVTYVDASVLNPYMNENSGSFSAWFKRSFADTVGAIRPVLATGNNASNEVTFWYSHTSDIWQSSMEAGGTLDMTSLSPAYAPMNTWTHLFITWSGPAASNYYKTYINGKLVGTRGSLGAFTGGFSYTYIGGSNVSASSHWDGQIDDVAFWDTPLTDDEINLIYSRQSAKFAGEMKSRIIDSQSTNSQWTSIDWVTNIPFAKELPGSSGSESSNDYSLLVGASGAVNDDNLMNGLVGLWHLNETSWSGTADEVVDSSGLGNHGVRYGDATTTSMNTKFNNAGSFDGTGDYVQVGSITSYSTAAGSVAGWMKVDRLAGPRSEHNILWGNGTTTATRVYLFNNYVTTDKFSLFGVDSSSTVVDCSGTTDAVSGRWYHVAATFDSGANEAKIYVDGKLENTCTYSDVNTNNHFIGAIPAVSQELDGNIDEVGIWSRVLHGDEVLQLYRRGANRIKYQVRSCSSSDCSDQDALTGDGWKGPGGNYLTYFSELYNNSSVNATCGTARECYSSELLLQGNVGTASPSINFSDFNSDGLVGIDINRYFQYRVIMESDDENTSCDSGSATCMPELKSVIIGPEHNYVE